MPSVSDGEKGGREEEEEKEREREGEDGKRALIHGQTATWLSFNAPAKRKRDRRALSPLVLPLVFLQFQSASDVAACLS